MAADIVPIRLGLTKGDFYTLWAPRWRDAGDEWEAFLGLDEDLYAFESVGDLVAFVRAGGENDLTDHPAWSALTDATAHKLEPAEENRYDIIGVAELLAQKPTEDSVESLHRTLAIVSTIGSVCELAAITKLFNGNPVLGSVGGGVEGFSGRSGRKRWAEIGELIDRAWDNVIDAIDGLVSTPEVDTAASEKADAELAEAAPEPEVEEEVIVEPDADESVDADPEEVAAKHAKNAVLGEDKDFWVKVGIDPIRIMTTGGTYYTLRCYWDDAPLFLGRNGRVSVFSSGGALARYLADEHDHDLADLSTYDDIRTAATDGSLRIDVTDENVYVLTGLADDIADGPDTVDGDQLELAIEFLRDIGEYSEENTVEATLNGDTALGKFVTFVLDADTTHKPAGPYSEAVKQWESLEAFVESRLRPE